MRCTLYYCVSLRQNGDFEDHSIQGVCTRLGTVFRSRHTTISKPKQPTRFYISLNILPYYGMGTLHKYENASQSHSASRWVSVRTLDTKGSVMCSVRVGETCVSSFTKFACDDVHALLYGQSRQLAKNPNQIPRIIQRGMTKKPFEQPRDKLENVCECVCV